MKLLVLVLFVCAASFASGGLISSAASNQASDVSSTASRANRNRNFKPAQDIETTTSAAAVTSLASEAVVAPAKVTARSARNAVTTSATPKAAALTKPRAPVAAPAPIAPSTPTAPPAPVAPPKPVAPVARLVPVETTPATATRGSKALAYAEAIATITSDNTYVLPDNSKTLSGNSKTSSSEGDSEILRYDAEVNSDGFRYSYETSNGISAESFGESKNVNGTDVIIIKGFYEYTDKDGSLVHVDYTADEEGYHPVSDVLPVAPPVPKEIEEAIKYILSQNKTKGDSAAK